MHRKKGASHTINVEWWDNVAELRKQACQTALKNMIPANVAAEDNAETPKIPQVRQQDEWTVGRTVIWCPKDLF